MYLNSWQIGHMIGNSHWMLPLIFSIANSSNGTWWRPCHEKTHSNFNLHYSTKLSNKPSLKYSCQGHLNFPTIVNDNKKLWWHDSWCQAYKWCRLLWSSKWKRDFHTILEGAHFVISSFTFNHSHKLACFSTLFFMLFITFACPQ